ncbi:MULTISPECIES: hypothetical protein [Bradyrhizobium]|uniref:terminase small subunit-like protein n=1 Tax=Bradyrhizobium TaxID=374 RepID=UPI00209F3DBB|nr:hypothetical protein [Bradyrhizobium elkanii]MCP1969913.1 hypothetical protein [Bradyrhizobium elkanii]MCS4108579.1 hypothetical protein [Bradyrhizobium elkanii]
MTTEAEIIPPEPKPKRPSEFTDEIFTEICDRMANGQGLRKICEDPEMPSRQTFLRWMEKDTGRQSRYQTARESLMDWYAEDIIDIAWDNSKDTIKDGKGEPKCNHEWINRSRLKVDTLKFLMAKLHPKRYGDKVPELEGERDLKISWQQQAEPVHRIERIILQGVAADERVLQRRIDELEAELEKAKTLPPPPPAQLTFQPDPLPGDLTPEDWSLLSEVLNLIRRTIPTDDNSPPQVIFGILRQALLLHFREVEIDLAAQAAE